MGEKTAANLKRAFQGESEAYFRNMAFAEAADREELPQIAKLFRAIAEGEAVHARSVLRLRGIVKDSETNLERAFGTESIAANAYPPMIRDAMEEGEEAVARVFSSHRDVEAVHGALYKKAMADLMEGTESTYQLCTICGYVTDGPVPERCPVCNAPASRFKVVG